MLNSLLVLIIFDGISVHPLNVAAIISLAACILLLGCSALISGSEVAFFSFDSKALKEMEDSENISDKKILQALRYPQYLLATILIGSNFVNVAIILLFTYFSTTVLNYENAPVLGFISQAVIITFLLLLFSEVVPKVYATQNRRKTAGFTAGFLVVLQMTFSPLVKFLVNSTTIINKWLTKKKGKNTISIDKLSQALEITSRQNNEDTKILESIIKFGNIQVSDIMTPRIDITSVDVKSNYKDLLKIIADSGYSRIPVYSENRSNVRGFIYNKDLLPHLDKPVSFRWQSLMRQPYYIPESKKIDDLLNEFQANKIHMAVVVDEYGGTSGLITLEDILEEIVGDIADEYDDEEKSYTKIDNNTFIFEAKILLNDFYKIAEIEKDDFTKLTEDVETLAGLILELKGEIPAKNEIIKYGKYTFEMLSVDDRRIKKIKLYIDDDVKESEEENDED